MQKASDIQKLKITYSGHTILMKKQICQENFKRRPGGGHKFTREFIFLLLFYFFAASLCGFLWEVLIFLVKEGHFRNRGFLYGPWLPVYGSGAVLIYLLLSGLKRQPIKAFLYSLLIGTSLEFLIGWVLDFFWGLRYWDYTGSTLSFHGYICLASALGIGVAGGLWICLLSSLLEKIWLSIPEKIRRPGMIILSLLFLLDCAVSLIFPNTGRGITFSR